MLERLVPNGLLLTHPLINSSPNGAYALHAIQIPVPERISHDLDRIEAAASAAADRAKAEQAVFRDTWRALSPAEPY